MNYKKQYAPIVLFVYNRPEHTKQTLEALAVNLHANESDLIVYSDAPKDQQAEEGVQTVRSYIKKIKGFKSVTIIERDKNWGLANSIIDGVTSVVNQYGKVIVLEDDIFTSPYFLRYMNKALDYYENKKKVWHISGWNYPINTDGLKDVFFWRVMNCWGWATWKNRWQYYEKNVDKIIKTFSKKDIYRFDLNNSGVWWNQVISNKEGKINTWAIFWYATIFKNKGLCLNPSISFVNNIGLDGSGVHCGVNTSMENKIINDKEINFKFIFKKENKLAVKRIMHFYGNDQKPYILQLKERIIQKSLRIYKKIKNYIHVRQGGGGVTFKCNYKWFGNDYGGFYICPDLLKKENRDRIIYSIGIGEDISFDIDIINEFSNCKIYAFDPTPKSIEWVKKQQLPKNIIFYPFGISSKAGIEKMFLPKNKNHVSGSIYESDHLSQDDIIYVQMRCIEDIVKENEHKYIDIIKMDIEGAEFSVIDKLDFKKVNCGQILIETHERFFINGVKLLRKMIKKLNTNGYYCFAISKSGQEYSFINKRLYKTKQ